MHACIPTPAADNGFLRTDRYMLTYEWYTLVAVHNYVLSVSVVPVQFFSKWFNFLFHFSSSDAISKFFVIKNSPGVKKFSFQKNPSWDFSKKKFDVWTEFSIFTWQSIHKKSKLKFQEISHKKISDVWTAFHLATGKLGNSLGWCSLLPPVFCRASY